MEITNKILLSPIIYFVQCIVDGRKKVEYPTKDKSFE